MKTYETERLIIKPIDLDDAGFILKLYNMPKFIQYIGDKNIRSISDAENYIKARFLPQLQKLGFGNYTITLKENHEIIGAVGVFERDGLPIMDIGFSFLEEYEGKGYAYESAMKVKSIAMDDFGLQQLSAIVAKNNFASQKLIQKLGLVFQKYVTLPGEEEELLYFEYPQNKS
ncbi:GNAT family acetyltransferase [Elizabethkingia meningoseptica]|uniref:GNAT family N-acetyltransferase n=1 Tax=Elizabethkingia meningoseptica TaxID=238 RepID=UPI000332BD51|nr:GNAT family N-acetyltransferase [Elizabethkingia meningoseptica]AQX04467.1 GNAT family acetyltransferase [Elizabethkingia meningoseptica]AQX46508.1 GNAT family acetyltransferase [Elizabethkingia meningoseptica]EOR31533.1 GNAT family acetyltransferase [Elizabethkingia meningoseptica ATCC 13253 = NBRC 12535]KUY19023.1 GNAT family acetyltransferase [Elizabethkingia meningoseptica]OPB75036.1 GNAT family acetyltransferase [Elizabethkingia meningoseptica]